MRNPLTTAKNQRNSKFLGNRRKRQLGKMYVSVLPENKNLTAKKRIPIFCRILQGIYHVKYKSEETGRFAQGFGATLEIAFENMNNHFNEKYIAS